MINWIKKLVASKISINITIVGQSDINHTTTPTVIDSSPIHIKNIRKSDLRFIQEKKVDHFGKTTVFWFTEQYRNGRWHFISDSLSGQRQLAMDLHLKLLEKNTLEPTNTKTILWEGLGNEETKSWIAMQQINNE